MIIDNELPALERRAVDTPEAVRRGEARRSGAAQVESATGSSFSNIADEVDRKTQADKGAVTRPIMEKGDKNFHAWQDSDFSFSDVLDIINPLQHLPIVATFYRNLTGDQIGMAPRVIGGALWGRIGGFVAGIVNAAVEWFTGKDIGDHIYSAIWGNSEIKTEPTAVALTKEPNLAPAPRGMITEHEEIAPAASQTEELPAETPAAMMPRATAPVLTESPRRAILPIELLPSHLLLHHYRRGEEREDATDYEKKLRLTA